ncbi:tagatose-bisphosphate aldolase subunit KbaY [Candidatus Poribacteria bacterium]|nr:MAG: tagatose-bisphosphate aldolase subunit KbaY [Candidatus Poribacteria bacterium]
MVVSLKELMEEAERESFAVPAFNITDTHNLLAVVQAAEEVGSPIILQIWRGVLEDRAGLLLIKLAFGAAKICRVPALVHLDHGESLEQIVKAIKLGFHSVMIDRSLDPYPENLRLTRAAAEIAHMAGLPIEGEIGHVGSAARPSTEDRLTDPDQAAEFARETNVDLLAVAVGTAHGIYKRRPQLDFERLKAIRSKTGLPLVLHGGSGTPCDQLRRAVELGVRKVNIATDLFVSAVEGMRRAVEREGWAISYHRLMGEGREAVKAKALEIMDALGSSGRT